MAADPRKSANRSLRVSVLVAHRTRSLVSLCALDQRQRSRGPTLTFRPGKLSLAVAQYGHEHQLRGVPALETGI
jgi:hypothetical protein